jgi:Protein of unknown function (DUF1566)/Caspase domain/Glucodextranase, domain B
MRKIFLAISVFAVLAQAEFVRDDSRNVVVDTERKLMWQDDSDAKTVKKDWQGAIGYCQNLNLAGYNDWRLPPKDDLASLSTLGHYGENNIDTQDKLDRFKAWFKANKHKRQNYSFISPVFKNVSVSYWSSSPYVSGSSRAWNVFFLDGFTYSDVESSSYAVRCVRDSRDFDSLNINSSKNQQATIKQVKKTPKVAKDTTPPTLTISSPVGARALKLSSAESTISIVGVARDNVGVSDVTINGELAALDTNGNFSFSARTKVGENVFEIIATDTTGNETKKSVKVIRESAVAKAQKPQKPSSNDSGELGEVGRYFALVIGVQNYDDSEIRSLEFPVKDAKRFAMTLGQNYQFDRIIPLHNPTRADILGALEKLADEIKPSDNLLIFYAGHGYWDEKISQGYWLPKDAKRKSKASWLSNSELKDYLAGIKSRHTLLVSDACFGGSIFKTRNAFDEDKSAKALYELPSRIAMTSGALKEVPDKSVFLDYMIRRLDSNSKKFLSAGSLYSSFKEAVISASPNHQIPQYGAVQVEGNEGGDFIFIRKQK